MQNIDAWEIYCYWMGEMIEVFYETLKLESLDTYTLEAAFKKYLIENRTLLLRNEELEKMSKLLKLESFNPKDDRAQLERDIVRARNEAKQSLIVQRDTLIEIGSIIEIIQDAHPELSRLRIMAKILTQLMGVLSDGEAVDWEQQLVLMQLLHEEMGIISALNCSGSFERAKLAFAVQTATSLMKNRYGIDEILSMALKWHDSDKLKHFHKTVSKILQLLSIPFA